MKTVRFSSMLTTGLIFLSLFVSCSAKPNKELFYGTFANEKMSPPKTVHVPGKYMDYPTIADNNPVIEGSEQIVDYWGDAAGDIWFKTNSEWKGMKFHALQKISKSGTVLEMVSLEVQDFNSKNFPTKVDPAAEYYRVYYRQTNK